MSMSPAFRLEVPPHATRAAPLGAVPTRNARLGAATERLCLLAASILRSGSSGSLDVLVEN